jgi:hypothetical protein
MRSVNDELFSAYVVMPDGRIRTIRYQNSVTSPYLIVEKHYAKPGRVTSFGEVALSPGARRRGCALLKDLYAAEDRMDDWAVWLDYQDRVKVTGEKTEFPDEYLPGEVLVRRANAPTLGKWKPPTKAKAKRGPA